MLKSLPITLFLSFLVAFPASAGDEDGPSPDESIEKMDAALKLVRKPEEDVRDAAIEEVRAAVDVLSGAFASYSEDNQKKVVKSIGTIFGTKIYEGRSRDGEAADSAGEQIYFSAAAALSEMGPDAEKILKKAMGVKSLQKRVSVMEFLIEALGKHRNEKNIDMFIKLLVDDESKIVRAAIKSLSEYRESDGKVRKKISEALVKQYANTHNLDLKEKGRNPVWRERLTTIEVPMNEALGMLTLQSFQSAPDWEKWYNDNRSKNW